MSKEQGSSLDYTTYEQEEKSIIAKRGDKAILNFKDIEYENINLWNVIALREDNQPSSLKTTGNI